MFDTIPPANPLTRAASTAAMSEPAQNSTIPVAAATPHPAPSTDPQDRLDVDVGDTLYWTTRQTAQNLPRLAQAVLEAPSAQHFFFDRNSKVFGCLLGHLERAMGETKLTRDKFKSALNRDPDYYPAIIAIADMNYTEDKLILNHKTS